MALILKFCCDSIASWTVACMTSSVPITPCMGVLSSWDRLRAKGLRDWAVLTGASSTSEAVAISAGRSRDKQRAPHDSRLHTAMQGPKDTLLLLLVVGCSLVIETGTTVKMEIASG